MQCIIFLWSQSQPQKRVSASKHFKRRPSVIILGDSQWRGERLHVQFLSMTVTSSHKNDWTNSHPNLEIMFETVSELTAGCYK